MTLQINGESKSFEASLTLAALIFASNEFRQDLVQGFYQSFLHRAADQNGLNSFVGALGQG